MICTFTPPCRWLPDITGQYIFYTAAKAERTGFCGEDGSLCREAVAGPWRETTDAAVVIPHNSNISMGLMFQTQRPDGQSITVEDANRRQRYETLAEIIQHKGASECFFGPGATDELCDFEQLPWNSFTGNRYESKANPIAPDAGHLREVLKDGLAMEQQLGVNPFKFGFIGSTDTHRSLAGGVEEKGFQGHGGAGNAAAELDSAGLPDEWEFNPGGLAVLYAEENNRGLA